MKKFPSEYTEKTSLHNDDLLLVADSQSSNAVKKVKRSTLRTDMNSGMATQASLDATNSTVAGKLNTAYYTNATTSTAGKTKLSSAPVDPANPIAVGDNDPRMPTAGEKAALAGTGWSPSAGNKYVTNDDTAENTASKVVRRKSNSNITVPSNPTDPTDATSKAYVDSTGVKKVYSDIIPVPTAITVSTLTTLYSLTIPANSFVADTEILFRGRLRINAWFSGVLTFNIKFWGATIMTSSVLDMSGNYPYVEIEMRATFNDTAWVLNYTGVLNYSTTASGTSWGAPTYFFGNNIATASLLSDQTFTFDASRSWSGGSYEYFSSSLVKQ